MKALNETILAQYANSPALRGIIERFNKAADPSALIETFYKNVWNIETATGWGLDVWGRIVGVGRVQKVPSSHFLGFEEADDGSGTTRPFEDGILYAGTSDTSNYALSDDAFRKLIYARAAANISSGSITDINNILMTLFGDKGHIFLAEGTAADDYLGFAESRTAKDSPQTFENGVFFSASSLAGAAGTMTICHSWALSPLDATLIQQSGALPRPSGVRILYQQVHVS